MFYFWQQIFIQSCTLIAHNRVAFTDKLTNSNLKKKNKQSDKKLSICCWCLAFCKQIVSIIKMVLIFDAHSFDDIYCFDLCKIWCFVYRWTIRRPMARKMMLAALTTIQSMIKAKKQVCDFLSSRCNLDIFCVSLLHFFLYFKLLIARTHLLTIDVICREHKSNNKFLQIK